MQDKVGDLEDRAQELRLPFECYDCGERVNASHTYDGHYYCDVCIQSAHTNPTECCQCGKTLTDGGLTIDSQPHCLECYEKANEENAA